MPGISPKHHRPHGPWILSCVIHGLAFGLLSLFSVSDPALAPPPQAFQVSLIVGAPPWHSTGERKPLLPHQGQSSSTSTFAKPLPESSPRPARLLSRVSAHSQSVPPLRWDLDKHHSGPSSSTPRTNSVSKVLRDQSAQRALSNRVPVRFRDNPLPNYPQVARQAGWEGRSMLRVEVLRDGRSGMVKVKESCGHPLLDQAAVKAVKGWTFFPERDGKIAVRSVIDLPIRFQLSRIS